jgi:hypothetical protein
VWIDIAAVNQHPTEQQQDDLANLRNAIRNAKVGGHGEGGGLGDAAGREADGSCGSLAGGRQP